MAKSKSFTELAKLWLPPSMNVHFFNGKRLTLPSKAIISNHQCLADISIVKWFKVSNNYFTFPFMKLECFGFPSIHPCCTDGLEECLAEPQEQQKERFKKVAEYFQCVSFNDYLLIASLHCLQARQPKSLIRRDSPIITSV